MRSSIGRGVKVGQARVVHETDRAILVELEEMQENRWIPKSCVHDDSEAWQEGDEGELVLHEWFARKEGLV